MAAREIPAELRRGRQGPEGKPCLPEVANSPNPPASVKPVSTLPDTRTANRPGCKTKSVTSHRPSAKPAQGIDQCRRCLSRSPSRCRPRHPRSLGPVNLNSCGAHRTSSAAHAQRLPGPPNGRACAVLDQPHRCRGCWSILVLRVRRHHVHVRYSAVPTSSPTTQGHHHNWHEAIGESTSMWDSVGRALCIVTTWSGPTVSIQPQLSPKRCLAQKWLEGS